jgi:hypothetical protein
MPELSEKGIVEGFVQHLNPDGLIKNPAFTNVIVVTGSVKTIYVGGQDAVDAPEPGWSTSSNGIFT